MIFQVGSFLYEGGSSSENTHWRFSHGKLIIDLFLMFFFKLGFFTIVNVKVIPFFETLSEKKNFVWTIRLNNLCNFCCFETLCI